MLDVAFQYDCNQKSWVQSENREYIHKEIEKLPCILVSETKSTFGDIERSVFCPKHRRMELIKEWGTDFVESADGCFMKGLLALDTYVIPDRRPGYVQRSHPISRPPHGVYIPFRWRVFQRDPKESVHIACDVAEVSRATFKKVGKFLRWHCFSISVDMAKRKHQFTMLQDKYLAPEPKFWADAVNADIPDAVMEVAVEALRESTRLATGIKPTFLCQMKNKLKLMAYIERPFDANIVFLKGFLQEFMGPSFDREFPYEMKDNYKKFCLWLKVEPPKSVRKAYAYNPYAIIWFMIFKGWGYTDVNRIQKFLYLNERVANWRLDKMCYSNDEYKKDGWRVRPRRGASHWPLDKYARFMRAHGRGKHFLNWLYRFSTDERMVDWQEDILRMLDYNERNLSEEAKNHLLRDGLTHAVHDRFCEEINANRWGWDSACRANVHMTYGPQIMAYECGIGPYEFRVMQDTKRLSEVGNMLNNCVASYYNNVVNEVSIIVAVRHEDRWVACIELQKQRNILQALGQRNRLLEGDLRAACQLWAKLKDLELHSRHLDFRGAGEKEDAERLWAAMEVRELPEEAPIKKDTTQRTEKEISVLEIERLLKGVV